MRRIRMLMVAHPAAERREPARYEQLAAAVVHARHLLFVKYLGDDADGCPRSSLWFPCPKSSLDPGVFPVCDALLR